MSSVMDYHDVVEPIIELESHANMMVVGKNETLLDYTGNNMDVGPLTPEYQAMEKLSVVDAAVKYICKYTGKVYIIVFRN